MDVAARTLRRGAAPACLDHLGNLCALTGGQCGDDRPVAAFHTLDGEVQCVGAGPEPWFAGTAIGSCSDLAGTP